MVAPAKHHERFARNLGRLLEGNTRYSSYKTFLLQHLERSFHTARCSSQHFSPSVKCCRIFVRTDPRTLSPLLAGSHLVRQTRLPKLAEGSSLKKVNQQLRHDKRMRLVKQEVSTTSCTKAEVEEA